MQRKSLRLRADDGFTLVELLVVMVIIGVLAAVGLATFLNQRAKAQDAEAKAAAVTAAKAMAVFSSDTGDFTGATTGDLAKIERSLGLARGLTVDSTDDTFTVTVNSAAGDGAAFSIERKADGSEVRDCAAPGLRLCRADADANGNRW